MTRTESFGILWTTPSLAELRSMSDGERHGQQAKVASRVYAAARLVGIPSAAKCEYRELLIFSLRPKLLGHDEFEGGAHLLLDALAEAKIIYSAALKYLKVEYGQTAETVRPRTIVTVTWGGTP